MKQKKLAPFLAVTLSLELVISPVIGFAQTEVQGEKTTAQTFADGIKMATDIWQTTMETMAPVQNSQQTFDMQKLYEQQVPTQDKFFNSQRLSQIPGLGQYLALNNINPQMLDCKTLPTTLHEVRAEVCQMGVTTDRGINPTYQLEEMKLYYDAYFQIGKQYKNYSAESNSGGQLFGVGCMKNAMEILNGFFKYRLDELDKLTTNLEAMQDQFREASRSDLDAIEEAVAVLEGGNSELTDKVRSKRPDLFDFGKRFENQACTSMFPNDDFNKLGREKGLSNIKQTLKDTMNERTPNGYSGASYAKSHTAVVEDLENLSKKVAQQAKLRFSTLAESEQGYASFLKGLQGSVSSTTGANSALTADLFSDIQNKFTEANSKLAADLSTVSSEIRAGGGDPSTALSIVKNLNAKNFDSEVVALENQIQNGCLKRNLGSTLDSVLGRIQHRDSSGHANRNASNFLKDKIKAIMENDQTSMDKKLEELRALESDGGKYYVKMDNAREVQKLDQNGNIQTLKRAATVLQTPSAYFADSIENCRAQYQKNKLNSSLTGSGAISQLRKINQSYKKLAADHAIEMEKEVRKKLIECSSAEEANNTVAGSCTPSRFNSRAPGFCANAALSCSKNMQACTAQAEKFVKEINEQKTARVNNYKALVQKNKQDVIKIFDTALSQFMREGEMLRGIFGAGFSSPNGIQREVPEGSRYLSSFQTATANSEDGKLLLEDPDKYIAMFKQNINLLKESVRKQQDQILGGEQVGRSQGLLAEHIKKTERNYREVIREADSISNNCIAKYQDFVRANEQQRAQQQADQVKKLTELGEQRQQVCNLYGMLRVHPNSACAESITDLMAADPIKLGELKRFCLESGNEVSDDLSRMSDARIIRYCKNMDSSDSSLINACARFMGNDYWAESESPSGKLTKTYSQEAREGDMQLIAGYIISDSTDQDDVSQPSAPAYCMAGDNSQPGSSNKSMFEMISEAVQKGATAVKPQ